MESLKKEVEFLAKIGETVEGYELNIVTKLDALPHKMRKDYENQAEQLEVFRANFRTLKRYAKQCKQAISGGNLLDLGSATSTQHPKACNDAWGMIKGMKNAGGQIQCTFKQLSESAQQLRI